MKQIAVFVSLLIICTVTAVSCNLAGSGEVVTLPPTTTPIPRPQEPQGERPEPTTNPAEPAGALTATATLTPTATVTTYVIQPGDTLATIGNRFEVSVEELAEANDLTNPNAISAGQVLVIPEQAVAETAVPITPTNTPLPTATIESDAAEETAVPPNELEPTGRLEITHPLAMVVEESGVITVEIIADPALATIGEHEPHVTGVVRIDASYDDGERAYYEQTINLFPLMSAELNAPAFEVFPSGGDNVRLPRVISTTLPAVWTWDVIAMTPGDAQVITINLYKESKVQNDLPFLTQSISRNIRVLPKSRWTQVMDGLADNVLLLLGTGGPLGLALAYLTYRATKENERLKKEVATHKREREAPSNENE